MLSTAYGKWREAAPKAGFTLIELLVVIVIIGMLVTISVKYLSDARTRARATQTAANLSEIHNALEAFATDNNGLYPFRMRWFPSETPTNPTDPNAAPFDPYSATARTSNVQNWCSLGLFGGVPVVAMEQSGTGWNVVDNTWVNPSDFAKIIQPHYGDEPPGPEGSVSLAFTELYQRFNQYSDPLIAMGYLDTYPENPFLKRPMGNMLWNYGDDATGHLNKTIPGPEVYPTPGDFCYTFFYGTRDGGGSGDTLVDPPGVVEAKKSYVARSPQAALPGVYYLDLIDSYQLWAYGSLPRIGKLYVAYPNNFYGLAPRRGRGTAKGGWREAKRDWDNSGTKDMFEMGLVAYYKQTGAGASQASDTKGNKVEF